MKRELKNSISNHERLTIQDTLSVVVNGEGHPTKVLAKSSSFNRSINR